MADPHATGSRVPGTPGVCPNHGNVIGLTPPGGTGVWCQICGAELEAPATRSPVRVHKRDRAPVVCPHCGGRMGLCLVASIRRAILEEDTRLPLTPGEASRIALRVVYGRSSPSLLDDPLVRLRMLGATDEE